jgi:uncharacterized membrane protein YdfJ with MMPL/SSD domain
VTDRVLGRPTLAAVLSAGLLVALAAPALGLSLAKPSDEAVASQNEPALATLARVRSDFPSTASPAIVVASASRGQRSALQRATSRLESLAVASGIAHPPLSVTEAGDGQAASIELPLTGAGNNTASRNAIAALRDQLVPRTLGHVAGVQTAVTGAAAEDVDFTHQLAHATPYVIGFVLALAFLLLLFTFRSIVVPLKAIVLNLLSLSAAYGVLVLVFQNHWAEGLLGFNSNGAVISWLPLFLFVVLFGLSMDYHVFILSRVREAVDSGMGTDDALRYGITRTAGVVTSAALVMVGVFSLFASLSSLDLKQAGVGLASAILIDATVVRAVLLPASMKLLGEWNWYLPRWLRWVPHTEHEGPRPREQARGAPLPTESDFLHGLAGLDVEGPSREDLTRMAKLVNQYSSFPLGGTDASVIALAERLETSNIITLDRRHFSAIVPLHCDAFELLP